MSRNVSDNRQEREIYNRLVRLERIQRERGTVQVQGENAIQIGYTPDQVYTINVAPNTGLIGTFVFSLQYDEPLADSVVFGDVDIAVNKGTDTFNSTYNLSAYNGGLTVEVINDLYLTRGWYSVEGYYPIVKVVRLRTFPSGTADNFYIHYRWRYVGVGNTLVPVTGSISIIP